MTDTPTRSFWGRVTSDLALSLAATLLSLGAVVTTVWQTSIMREQLRLSVWPRVRIDFRYRTENEDRFFEMRLENVGVGPAIVKSMRTTFRGKQVPHIVAAYDAFMEENHVERKTLKHHQDTSVHDDEVLAPQQRVVLLLVRGGEPSPWDLFARLTPQVTITVRYASIYGELWETGFPDGTTRRIGWTEVGN